MIFRIFLLFTLLPFVLLAKEPLKAVYFNDFAPFSFTKAVISAAVTTTASVPPTTAAHTTASPTTVVPTTPTKLAPTIATSERTARISD